MIDSSLKIMLWDKEIGRLSWDARRGVSFFEYNPAFLGGRLDPFPLAVTAFLPFYPLVTNSLSITSDFCLSPLFIRRDKNGTKPENKISKNTFEPIKSLRHIVLSGAKFLQTSAMKTCFQIAECS